jgi:hypothetical protein
MLISRAYLGGIGMVALLLLMAALQPAIAPAALAPHTSAPATAVAGPAGVAVLVTATPFTELPAPAATPVASPTPAPAGSMTALAQTMLQIRDQMHAATDGQLSAAQMEQAMSQMATTSGQMAPMAVQVPQGTPDLRQMVALTLSQTGLLAAQLRDEAAALPPEQRTLAVRQMEVLALDVAQTISEVQDVSPQTGLNHRQDLMARMQHLLTAMRSMADRYHSSAPKPAGR